MNGSTKAVLVGVSSLAVVGAVVIGRGIGDSPSANRDPLATHTLSPTPLLSTTASVDSPTTSPTPTMTPLMVSAISGGLCGSPNPTDRQLPRVEVCVVYWCRGDVYDYGDRLRKDQAQIKLRPRIINNGSSSLRIAISRPAAVRLLVATRRLPGGWEPPRATQAAGDKPLLVSWGGQNYWAVPPNVPRDAYRVGRYYSGFATQWDGTTLAPGATYFKPRREGSLPGVGIREGDLVFQVPAEADGTLRIAGLAVLEFVGGRPVVLAVSPQSEWPPRVDPNYF